MKRSTISGIALMAALIALPASGVAQTPPQQPPATQPPATQPPTTTPPATEQPAAAPQASSAEEHLAKANAALNEIQPSAVTGAAQAKLMTLRKHMAALSGAGAAKGASKGTPANWASDVAAIDRILTELTTPATAPDPAPSTGTTGTTGTVGSRPSRAQAAITVDEATRAKLMEVRSHITAYAAAKSGTAVPAAQPAAPKDPSVTPPPTTPPTEPPTTPPPTEPPVTTQPPATAQPPATPPPATAAPAEAPTADKEAAKKHLTEARDTLSQLTQLPEAAQLTGDARTQVSQLIANFNELITTQAEWRAAFAKVQANLTALIGAERTDEANVPPPATGTAGAVGTSGMTTLDPKIREKLVEFRNRIAAFERAAGGGAPK
jgi:hypothetical protein